jgi:hypothetical protein
MPMGRDRCANQNPAGLIFVRDGAPNQPAEVSTGTRGQRVNGKKSLGREARGVEGGRKDADLPWYLRRYICVRLTLCPAPASSLARGLSPPGSPQPTRDGFRLLDVVVRRASAEQGVGHAAVHQSCCKTGPPTAGFHTCPGRTRFRSTARASSSFFMRASRCSICRLCSSIT